MQRVGILRGGSGDSYESSIQDGGGIIFYILENLGDKYTPIDILVDREGLWHLRGLPIAPSDLVNKVDIVWNLSEPRFSNILESFSIKTIGAPPFSSFMSGSREMLKEHMKNFGINLPRHIIIPAYQPDIDGLRGKYVIRKAKEVFEKFGSPWVVRSFPQVSGMGVHAANTFDELIGAIDDGISRGGSVSVEELIPGKDAEVHSVARFRGEDLYTMPISEDSKLSPEEKDKILSLTKSLYKQLGARSYFNLNFTLHPRKGVYITNIKFLPDLSEGSHFHRACEAIGSKAHHIIEHMLGKV